MNLKIGTDCSGMDAPLFALDNLGITYEYKFASEIDKFARKTIIANHVPEILYEDMTVPRVLPKIDLYICGFPCQPFSLLGLNRGQDDERCIFDYVFDTIVKTDPHYFILENVPTLCSNKYFKVIKEKLSTLNYNINYSIYCTSDYGVPQSRRRLYIVGTRHSFEVPQKVACVPIENFIIKSEKYDTFPRYIIERPLKDCVFINANVIRKDARPPNKDYCNTLTKNGDVWCIKEKRRASIEELLALQGPFNNFKKVVSDYQLKKQIGNSMSVCVVQAILKELLVNTK